MGKSKEEHKQDYVFLDALKMPAIASTEPFLNKHANSKGTKRFR